MTRRSGEKREATAEEISLWRETMRSAAPRANQTRMAPPANLENKAAVFPPAPDHAPSSSLSLRQNRTPAAFAAPPLEHGRAPGVDKKTAQRLRQGEREIEAVLDLHGYVSKDAHAALTRFIRTSFDLNRRCVLVITGKGARGEGIIRSETPRWLNASPLRGMVLAFSYAQPKHGGAGALYVLLKRRR